MRARATVLFAFLALLPWPAGAQGIGDAAAREKARRAKENAGRSAEPPSYGNEDLRSGKPEGKKEGDAAAPQAAGSTAPAESTPEPRSPQAELKAAEQPYLDAVAAAQKQLDALEARLKELQAMLNPMSSTYIYGGRGGAIANDEIRVRNELRDTEAQIPVARQALEAAKKDLSDFRAGRRREAPAGAPVG